MRRVFLYFQIAIVLSTALCYEKGKGESSDVEEGVNNLALVLFVVGGGPREVGIRVLFLVFVGTLTFSFLTFVGSSFVEKKRKDAFDWCVVGSSIVSSLRELYENRDEWGV